LALSMSARVRRTIGIPFLPVRITQADDPAYLSTLGIDAMQRHIPDNTDCPDTGLAIVPSFIGTLDRGTVEQKSGKLERQSALAFVPFALGAIPLKIHRSLPQMDMGDPSETYNMPASGDGGENLRPGRNGIGIAERDL
jgi:hypothetical protein